MREFDKHHIIPKSRGGGKKTIVKLPIGFHRALHQVFQNLRPDEYQVFLDTVLQSGESWTNKELHILRKRIISWRES